MLRFGDHKELQMGKNVGTSTKSKQETQNVFIMLIIY